MKKTIITILTLFLFVSLNAQSPLEKRIDFSIHRLPVKNALRQLSLESKINIAFSSDFFNKKKRVSVNVKNETVENILAKVLDDSNVKYEAIDQQIIVTSTKPKEKKLYTISGYVEDETSGERLISVTIYSPNHREGTTTNEYGFYSITLPEGETELSVRYIGCDEVNEKIMLEGDLRKSISLKPSLELSEVVVLANQKINESEAIFETNHESIEKLKRMPTLGRGGDLMKQINFLPGVESGVEGLGGMFVRGGNIDQNLTMMDGVIIYNPSHLFGLFSVYNHNAVKSIRLYKGDFPARYGGRISSVLDVRTKDGNTKKIAGELNPGFLSTRVSIEGPIIKDKVGFAVTSRFSTLTGLTKIGLALSGEDEVEPRLNFYDLNVKFHYSISEKDKLYLSYYSGRDIFKFSSYQESNQIFFDGPNEIITGRVENPLDARVNWGNDVFAIRWNHLFNNQLFSNTTLTYSRFNFELSNLDVERNYEGSPGADTLINYNYNFIEFENHITDLGVKVDFDYIPSPKHYVRFGASLVGHSFGSGNTDEFVQFENPNDPENDPDLNELRRSFGEESDFSAIELDTYLEDEIAISKSFKTNVGLRISVFSNSDNKWYGSIEPRIQSKYFISNRWSLSSSISRTNQKLHLLTSTGLGLPFDTWIPSVQEIRPQIAWQGTLGLQYYKPQSFKFKVEGFFKKMNHLIALTESLFEFEELTISDTTFIKGRGKAYGVELSLEKDLKKGFLFAYYTLSKSDRKFSKFNLGKSYPFQYDRKHSLKLGGIFKVRKRMNLSFTWTFFTGTPRIYADLLNDISGETGIPEYLLPQYLGKFNQKRNPNYDRLDVKVDFTFVKKRGTHLLSFNVYNLYFKRNVLFYERVPIYSNNTYEIIGYREVANPLPVIIPSINYAFRF